MTYLFATTDALGWEFVWRLHGGCEDTPLQRWLANILDEEHEEFLSRISSICQKRKWTYRQLAEAVSLNAEEVYAWYCGTRRIYPDELLQVAGQLGVPLATLYPCLIGDDWATRLPACLCPEKLPERTVLDMEPLHLLALEQSAEAA